MNTPTKRTARKMRKANVPPSPNPYADTSPASATVVKTSSCTAGNLPDGPPGIRDGVSGLADELVDRTSGSGGPIGLSHGPHQPTADNDPVGDPTYGRRLLGGADPEADGDRCRRRLANRRDQLRKAARELVPLPSDACIGDDVDESPGVFADSAAPPRRRGRRHERHRRKPGAGQRIAELVRLAKRQIGDDHARCSGAGEERAEPI